MEYPPSASVPTAPRAPPWAFAALWVRAQLYPGRYLEALTLTHPYLYLTDVETGA